MIKTPKRPINAIQVEPLALLCFIARCVENLENDHGCKISLALQPDRQNLDGSGIGPDGSGEPADEPFEVHPSP